MRNATSPVSDIDARLVLVILLRVGRANQPIRGPREQDICRTAIARTAAKTGWPETKGSDVIRVGGSVRGMERLIWIAEVPVMDERFNAGELRSGGNGEAVWRDVHREKTVTVWGSDYARRK